MRFWLIGILIGAAGALTLVIAPGSVIYLAQRGRDGYNLAFLIVGAGIVCALCALVLVGFDLAHRLDQIADTFKRQPAGSVDEPSKLK